MVRLEELVPAPAPSPEHMSAASPALFSGDMADISTAKSPAISAMNVLANGNLTDKQHVGGGSHCDAGCITGAVIGGVAGLILLLILFAFIWMYCRRRRNSTRSVAGSQVDLLEDSISSAQGMKLSNQLFVTGDEVFCKDNISHAACPVGIVVSPAGENLYKVKLQDGTIHVVSNAHMAPHFHSDANVTYMPPDGREGVNCTVIAADGSFWPPFYHLRPDNSSLDSINTTAEHLSTFAKKESSDSFGSDILARAV